MKCFQITSSFDISFKRVCDFIGKMGKNMKIRRMERVGKSLSMDDKGPNPTGKGVDLNSSERKVPMRRTRGQKFDINNIVFPYSMAACARVEQLIYVPVETPRWRVLTYSEIFSPTSEDKRGKVEDMSDTAFRNRHEKCEIAERKRRTAPQRTRKTRPRRRQLDSRGRGDCIRKSAGLSAIDSTLSFTPRRFSKRLALKNKN